MSLPVINTEWALQQDAFSVLCKVPSLGLSCFGCCGHHFKDKKTMHQFFANNKRTLEAYKKAGKSYKEFMDREKKIASCGGCYNLIKEKDDRGREQYLCAVHPLRIGGDDIRVGHCDHDYLCKTAAHVNKMTADEKKLFYEFLKEQQFDSYTFSMINSKETELLRLYKTWREQHIKRMRAFRPECA
jgi:hypothetical protein